MSTLETVAEETGLSATEQAARAALAHLWALRVLTVMHVANCDIRLALRAVEATEAAEECHR